MAFETPEQWEAEARVKGQKGNNSARTPGYNAAPLSEFDKFYEQLEKNMPRVDKDAAIGRKVREYFESGNNVPIDRITVKRSDVEKYL